MEILDSLSCLFAARLEHQALTCSNILFGLDGTIKIGNNIFLYLHQDQADSNIAGLESCVDCLPDQVQAFSMRPLSSIMMELMQTYDKNDGVVGVDDLDCWPVDSDAFGFLSTASSTVTIEALKQVSQFSVGSPCSLSTDLSLWNSIRSSISQINIMVSLCAWLDVLQSLRGHSILSKLGFCDANLLVFPFNNKISSPSIRRHLCPKVG